MVVITASTRRSTSNDGRRARRRSRTRGKPASSPRPWRRSWWRARIVGGKAPAPRLSIARFSSLFVDASPRRRRVERRRPLLRLRGEVRLARVRRREETFGDYSGRDFASPVGLGSRNVAPGAKTAASGGLSNAAAATRADRSRTGSSRSTGGIACRTRWGDRDAAWIITDDAPLFGSQGVARAVLRLDDGGELGGQVLRLQTDGGRRERPRPPQGRRGGASHVVSLRHM